ncbi:5-carboxymethyl-2-hydroxymuconate isomerase [Pelagivirga sediminicola]|uniref:5-carboxymethyl-2-hydroxymuconate isomerase n=1 Tax=Pelagivirga sediminicola TaxID=2170575 RepID=A0A2T7G627_9RHOB|nr:5-carboxymethyl-2-hydroxymuconate isomerase [Pelagivirga sediminicola]PVA09871.1 5-carboxymethyl-2-hydroxymuconate isomerase [Pelagivirga sediminicola]
MPHVVIEHSPDAAPGGGMQALCAALMDALAAHPAIPKPETLKLRTHQSGAHLSGTQGQSYAHATLLLLPGRDGDTKSDLAQTILRVMAEALPQVHSLSVNLADLDSAYAKRVLPDETMNHEGVT